MFFVERVHSWSDSTVLTAACDVLKQSGGYPTEANRRALYKEWLAIYASQEWEDSFDELVFLCIAFTPSPTSPTEPLFGDCFKMAADGSWDPVLDTAPLSQVFNRRRLDDEELPKSSSYHQLPVYLFDLLSREGSEALNEAGMLIGFCSLLLCAACVEDAEGAGELFATWTMPGPSSIFRTSFVGRVPCPKPPFLLGLRRKTLSPRRVLIPYAVVLPVAQFVLLKKAGADAPMRDLAFLGSAFLRHTKFIGLETVDMLRRFANMSGRRMRSLNALMGGKECEETRGRVENYLRRSVGPVDVYHSMPWCRVICCHLFPKLEVKFNVAYNLRILSFLEDDRQSSIEYLHSIPAFAEITLADVARARLWANNFRVLLSKGLFRSGDDSGPAETSVP